MQSDSSTSAPNPIVQQIVAGIRELDLQQGWSLKSGSTGSLPQFPGLIWPYPNASRGRDARPWCYRFVGFDRSALSRYGLQTQRVLDADPLPSGVFDTAMFAAKHALPAYALGAVGPYLLQGPKSFRWRPEAAWRLAVWCLLKAATASLDDFHLVLAPTAFGGGEPFTLELPRALAWDLCGDHSRPRRAWDCDTLVAQPTLRLFRRDSTSREVQLIPSVSGFLPTGVRHGQWDCAAAQLWLSKDAVAYAFAQGS